MVLRKGHLYAALDAGMAVCWKSDDGKEVWKGRLGDKGSFTSSLVLAGEHLFATSEAGVTYVFEAKPDGLKVAARNRLGQEAYASPAVCGGRIYLRAASGDKGGRKETLYCVGKK
jgi:outer membrane protein assembly factor BamB